MFGKKIGDMSKPKKAIYVVSWVLLVMAMADIILFVAYTLRLDGSSDELRFFVSIFVAVVGVILYAVSGMAYASGKDCSIYRISFAIMLVGDITNIVYDASYISDNGASVDGYASMYFYLAIDILNMLFNIMMIMFVCKKLKRTGGVIGAVGLLSIISFYMYDIIKQFVTCEISQLLENKEVVLNSFSNLTVFIMTVMTLVLACTMKTNNKK